MATREYDDRTHDAVPQGVLLVWFVLTVVLVMVVGSKIVITLENNYSFEKIEETPYFEYDDTLYLIEEAPPGTGINAQGELVVETPYVEPIEEIDTATPESEVPPE